MSFFLDKKKGSEGPMTWEFEKEGQLTSCQTRATGYGGATGTATGTGDATDLYGTGNTGQDANAYGYNTYQDYTYGSDADLADDSGY